MFRCPNDLSESIVPQVILDKELHTCEHCLQSFNNSNRLDYHIRGTHRKILKRKLIDLNKNLCTICLKEFQTKLDLIEHIKSEHLLSSPSSDIIEREIFICYHCNELFLNKHLLEMHIYYYHTHLSPRRKMKCFKCRRYLYKFESHANCHKFHFKTCCKICLTLCSNTESLSKHMGTHFKLITCDYCDKNFNCEFDLDSHFKDFHIKLNSKLPIDKVLTKCFLFKTKHKLAKRLIAIRGIKLRDMNICILCRGICLTKDEMIAHVQERHDIGKLGTLLLKPMCTCGEVFINNILLKHHLFKMGPDHSAADKILMKKDGEKLYEVIIEENEIDNSGINQETLNTAEGIYMPI